MNRCAKAGRQEAAGSLRGRLDEGNGRTWGGGKWFGFRFWKSGFLYRLVRKARDPCSGSSLQSNIVLNNKILESCYYEAVYSIRHRLSQPTTRELFVRQICQSHGWTPQVSHLFGTIEQAVQYNLGNGIIERKRRWPLRVGDSLHKRKHPSAASQKFHEAILKG